MENFNTYDAWFNAIRENSNSEYPSEDYAGEIPAIHCTLLA